MLSETAKQQRHEANKVAAKLKLFNIWKIQTDVLAETPLQVGDHATGALQVQTPSHKSKIQPLLGAKTP